MVVLQDVEPPEYDDLVRHLARTHQFTVVSEWREGPIGFICEGLTEVNLQRLASDPNVAFIEEDFELVISAMQWTNAPDGNYLWNLDRIDEATYAMHDGQYNMCPEGRSVVAYVIDTGVRRNHDQFRAGEVQSRVIESLTFNGIVENAATGLDAQPEVDSPLRSGDLEYIERWNAVL